ncbi:MAG: hypothetical protein CV087_20040 [Candidatus Brocadia sp. WS118]|nr:MAG: hypothetical protein CV087_20040 [Candidatus Brocadia sp. WS118]
MKEYKDKLKSEQQWHTSTVNTKHFLNSKWFFSYKRNDFNYIFPKQQLSKCIIRTIKSNNPSVLIAPLGTGDDIKYIRPLAGDIHGIDISREAVEKISHGTINKHVGDISNMNMFADNQFDIVLVPLFFHHFVKYGFSNFLKEIYRVLKPGGHFFAIEPSSFYPLNSIIKCIKKATGNITGAVEDETSFSPFLLSNAMKHSGFVNVKVIGAGFVHNRTPIFIAKLINKITYPLLKLPFIKYFAWMCIFYGKK